MEIQFNEYFSFDQQLQIELGGVSTFTATQKFQVHDPYLEAAISDFCLAMAAAL